MATQPFELLASEVDEIAPPELVGGAPKLELQFGDVAAHFRRDGRSS